MKWVTDLHLGLLLMCWSTEHLCYSSGTCLDLLERFLVWNTCCAAARACCLPIFPTFAAIQSEDLPHRNASQPMGFWLEVTWNVSLLESHVDLLTGKQEYFAIAVLFGMWYSSALLSLPFPTSLERGMFSCWKGNWSCNSTLMCRAGTQK